jgi:hypothetical protein
MSNAMKRAFILVVCVAELVTAVTLFGRYRAREARCRVGEEVAGRVAAYCRVVDRTLGSLAAGLLDPSPAVRGPTRRALNGPFTDTDGDSIMLCQGREVDRITRCGKWTSLAEEGRTLFDYGEAKDPALIAKIVAYDECLAGVARDMQQRIRSSGIEAAP